MKKKCFTKGVSVLFLLLFFISDCTCRRKQLKPKSAIEYVDTNTLEELIEKEQYLAAFFHTKVCRTCDKILQELQKINDDAEHFGVQFVKNDDRGAAEKYGSSKMPSLVYFRNGEPIVFDGDLMNEDSVLAFLTDLESMELPDAIEEVNAKLLSNLIDETEFVAVIFYKLNCSESESVLHDLEEIDHKADENEIAVVKTCDESLAMDFGLETTPALLYYRNKVPLLYDGDLHDEKHVLSWLIKHKDPEADVIEEISAKILTALIDNSTHLAVLFYDKANETSKFILNDLEAVDHDAKKNGIPFMKISDSKIALDFGIDEIPALIFFQNHIPNFYTGNLSSTEVLEWLIHLKTTNEIEDVTYKVMQLMIRTTDFLAVLFHDSKSPESQSVLKELEAIDEHCDKYGIPLVKIDDDQLEALYGIKNPPTLGFYNKQIPKFYEGDLKNKEKVLNWLIEQTKTEEIEDVSRPVLEQLIKTNDYLSVLFYDKNSEKSHEVIKELENIDDEASQKNLPFIKISDLELAKSYGIPDLPVLLYFKKQIPSVYQGNLKNEEEVLSWMTKQMSSDEIEEVTEKLLGILIAKHDLIAVLFYDPSSSSNTKLFQQLENIDDKADEQGIIFLKTSDLKAAEKYGLEYLPALVFFYQRMPNLYSGDLSNEAKVLEWFTNQLTKDEVEDVTEKMLLNLVKNTQALAVLFYDDSAASTSVQKEMEEIDSETGAIGIPFVKIDDESLARQFGFTDTLPILVYFENRIPSVFSGNLKSAEVLAWLTKQKNEDSIEEVTEELLHSLMKDNSYILTFFEPDDCTYCKNILLQLEGIDDDMDSHGILLLSTRDVEMATKTANVTQFPSLVMYRNGEPVVYEGDVLDVKGILKWSTSEETLDLPGAIEEVNSKMLEKLLTESHSLAVLFYQRSGCPECEKVLQDLENIDEVAEKNEIDFVKVSDPEIAQIYEVDTFPSLIFFRRQAFEFYSGDLSKEEEVLAFLIENRDRPDSFIEYISRRDLEIMLEGPTIAVFFYEENCTICDNILITLETIDDDLDRYGVQIVKTDDVEYANELGVSIIPSLVYFENMIPSIFDGDLTREDDVLRWLVQQKTEDTIENINREMLFRMIEEQDYLAIYFYKEHDKESKEILKHLEQIDDDCSDYEVTLLKMSDSLMAKKYKVRNPPGLVFFRHGIPIQYSGDLTDEEDVLEWLTSPENMESKDSIEKVNRRMLERVLTRSDFLAVFFYKKAHCRGCVKALEELEKIDDDAQALGIEFVKIEDPKLARSIGVFSVPSIVFFRYGNTEDPVVFAGNVRNGEEILGWLKSQKDPGSDMIEEMDGDELEELIETADFLAVLFYDPDEEDCPECQSTLADLENIDDDTDRHGILFVKTTDDSIATDYGLTKFPALIYFENNVPSIYEGDISAEEEVLQWLIQSKSEDTIETVNRDMFDKLIKGSTPYLVVVFYKQQTKASDEALEHLETIDGLTDEYGIQMVKTQDGSLGRRYGVTGFPAVLYFRNGFPLIYKEDITDGQAVLDWLLSDGAMFLPENIEEVNNKMLGKLISKFQLLAVYFYEKECDECIEILKSLEDIDEEADLFAIGFVKVSDTAASVEWNVQEIPALAYFRKQSPVFYEGSLSDAEGVLDWLTSQDMIEFKNEIEQVSRKMFDKLLQENDFFTVYFYDDNCTLCEDALKQLELIDDEIEELDIVFVKLKDAKYARRYGVKNLPALTYFRKRLPTQFRGDIMNSEETLNWLKQSRYRKRELNLFMFSMIAMGAAFIQYTLFLKFCFAPMMEKQS